MSTVHDIEESNNRHPVGWIINIIYLKILLLLKIFPEEKSLWMGIKVNVYGSFQANLFVPNSF